MIKLLYPDKSFNCIVEDYPWDYRDKGHRGNEGGTRPDQRLHPLYDKMSLPEIYACGPEIMRLASDSCHRWTWTVEPFIEDTIHLLSMQGFSIKRWFIWVKTTYGIDRSMVGLEEFSKEEIAIAEDVMNAMGIGRPYPRAGGRYWGKTCVEFLVMSSNSRSLHLANGKQEGQVFFAPSPMHSAKPDVAFDLIRRNSPGPRLSIFERSPREGFECWGNEMSIEAGEETEAAA